jgi:hypothetical protein
MVSSQRFPVSGGQAETLVSRPISTTPLSFSDLNSPIANNNFNLKLNRRVHGSDIDQIFIDQVESSNNVSKLKAAVKEENKHSFASINATSFSGKYRFPLAGISWTRRIRRVRIVNLWMRCQVPPHGMFEFFAMSFVN